MSIDSSVRLKCEARRCSDHDLFMGATEVAPAAVGEPTVEAVEENAHKVSLNVFVRATKKNKFKKNNRI